MQTSLQTDGPLECTRYTLRARNRTESSAICAQNMITRLVLGSLV